MNTTTPNDAVTVAKNEPKAFAKKQRAARLSGDFEATALAFTFGAGTTRAVLLDEAVARLPEFLKKRGEIFASDLLTGFATQQKTNFQFTGVPSLANLTLWLELLETLKAKMIARRLDNMQSIEDKRWLVMRQFIGLHGALLAHQTNLLATAALQRANAETAKANVETVEAKAKATLKRVKAVTA
jgi:hypothetical protein